MRKAQDDGKLRISSKRIVFIFIILFLVFEIIFYFSFQRNNLWPLEQSFYFYTPALLVSSAFFCYISITKTYYIIDKHKIQHFKMGKQYEYYWSSIIYIDQEWSKRHKMLLFYQEDGKGRYLAFDKNGVIWDYAIKYSHLITEEEFRERFPKVKL